MSRAEPPVWRTRDLATVQADATIAQATLTGEHPLSSRVFPQSDGTASGANTLKTPLRCHGTLLILISPHTRKNKNSLGCTDVHGTHTCPTAPRADLLYSILPKPDSTDRIYLYLEAKYMFVCFADF